MADMTKRLIEIDATARMRTPRIGDRLTVLHYDADFDTAATILDFEHRRVAQPGTL